MKKRIGLFLLIELFFSLNSFYSTENEIDYYNTNFVPWIINESVFQKLLQSTIHDEDKFILEKSYFHDRITNNRVLKKFSKEDMDNIVVTLNKSEKGRELIKYEKERVDYESKNPVFSQKGGMLRALSHSFYFRTDDELTGFSTIFLGYRFAPSDYFNFSVEGGIGLPQLYLANILLHIKIYETKNKIFFLGLRARIGYKYQHSEDFMFMKDKDGNDTGYMGLGKDYLTITDRHSIYFATDITVAWRFGRLKAQTIYYTIFPKIDLSLTENDIDVLFCQIMLGYEVRFGRWMEWSFEVEGGYTFPLPWGIIPDGKWINFPSLANVSVNYFIPTKNNSLYNKLLPD